MSDSDVVIRVEGLGKRYALHHETSDEEFWALKNVSFEIRRGERVASLLEVGMDFHLELP